jgi:hypothetical protein
LKKGAAIFALGVSLGAGGAISTTGLHGTVFVRFIQELPDGGTRELGRTGCYALDKDIKAIVETCSTEQ